MNQSEKKDELRQRFRRERTQKFIPSSFTIILKALEVISATVVTSYLSFAQEPSTVEINKELLAVGKTLLLPRIIGDELEWVSWNGDDSQLNTKKRIHEPLGETFTDLSSIGAVIVPALRIDQEGFRLGQGGGYYDKALPKLSGWKIGLVHSGELTSEKLPREDHDIALDAAATPEIIVRFKRN